MPARFSLSRAGERVVFFQLVPSLADGSFAPAFITPQPPQPPQPAPTGFICTNYVERVGCKSAFGVFKMTNNAKKKPPMCGACAQELQAGNERRNAITRAARALLRAPSSTEAGELSFV